MANEYKIFNLKEIEEIINSTALANMMASALMQGKKLDGTLMSPVELHNYNSLISAYNQGVLAFAEALKVVLRGDDADE